MNTKREDKFLDIRGKTNLTDSQFFIWLKQEIHPDVPLYNSANKYTISGDIDPDTFRKAFQLLIDSNDVLRTVIEIQNGLPYQRVMQEFQYTMEYIEFSEEKINATRIENWVKKRTNVVFNMEKCLFDSVLIKLSGDKYIWFLNMHHIIRDQLADTILFKRMSKLYGTLINKIPQESIKPPQFSCYIEYEKQYKKSSHAKEAKSYWENKLEKKHEPLEFYGRHRKKKISKIKRVVRNLSNERIEKLKSIAMNKDFFTKNITVSLYNIFLTIFSAYLYRMSGNNNFFIETPHHNRRLPEFKKIIGLFMTVRPLQIDIEDGDTFLSLTYKISKQALETLKYAKASPGNPQNICDVSLNYVPFSSNKFNGIPVKNKHIRPEYRENVLDLRIVDNLSENEMLIKFDFDCDVFDDNLQKQAVEHFFRVLDAFLENNRQTLNNVSLLSKVEEKRILKWNDTDADYPSDICIHELFEAQAERTPNRVALIFDNKQVTYDELNKSANQMAHYLRSYGAGPETLIGICLERSVEMMVGLLGILKTGGAYIPLNPDYPEKRLAFMLEDAQPPVLLIQECLLEKLPKKHKTEIVCLDADWPDIAKESDDNIESAATPDNLAYVIYTSGSTGKPKGTMITHRGLANYINWAIKAYDVESGTGAPVHSPITFDLTITSLLLPLAVGKSVFLLPDEAYGIETLCNALRHRNNFSLIKITPAHLKALACLLDPDKASGLAHRFIIGGEALMGEDLVFWQTHAPNTLLINEYGPTETVVGCCVYEIPNNIPIHGAIPIGRPIANTRLYVLDSHLNPLSIGVPGELYIGGDGVARGYLNNDKLTAEKFIADPFCDKPGSRLFKTGDMVRYLPDGNLEFLGRLDSQVKIHGFRIETGEIEAVLREHPSVREAVVIVNDDGHGDKRLIAYVVILPKHHKSGNQKNNLLSFLEMKLPSYMLPARFVFLDELPLTPNGKVDTRALPVPDKTRDHLTEAYMAPRTITEKALADIWADVLNVEYVGINDDFFRLGGHSIQSIQLVARIISKMKCNISIKTVFTHPTVSSMAELIDQSALKTSSCKQDNIPVGGAGRIWKKQIPSSLRIEHRPLLSLFSTGTIAPVDSVALSYLEHANPVRGELIRDWLGGLPFLREVRETLLGRVAIIVLPCFDIELYDKGNHLDRIIMEALEMARHIGAGMVSLTGLIPSATDYGQAIVPEKHDRKNIPAISTGHATTTATVVLTLRRILNESRREMIREHVGFLGLGSIGTGSLNLMLETMPHPRSILLCDVYGKLRELKKIENNMINEFRYKGNIRIVDASAEVPSQFYESTLIIGATNIPDILDIARVRPGTMIVDDSAPHCFDPELARQRFETTTDILFTEGGVLQSPGPIKTTIYLSESGKGDLTEHPVLKDYLSRYSSVAITGCILSGLLSARFDELKPTLGLACLESTMQNYETLNRLGYDAAGLHCKNYVLPEQFIDKFRYTFGGEDKEVEKNE